MEGPSRFPRSYGANDLVSDDTDTRRDDVAVRPLTSRLRACPDAPRRPRTQKPCPSASASIRAVPRAAAPALATRQQHRVAPTCCRSYVHQSYTRRRKPSWMSVGLGSQVFPNQVFDHALIIRSLREIFSLVDPLTQRDAAAATWSSALLSTPRTVSPLSTRRRVRHNMNRTPRTSAKCRWTNGALTPMGIAHIAVDIDWYVAERMHTAPAIPSGDSPV